MATSTHPGDGASPRCRPSGQPFGRVTVPLAILLAGVVALAAPAVAVWTVGAAVPLPPSASVPFSNWSSVYTLAGASTGSSTLTKSYASQRQTFNYGYPSATDATQIAIKNTGNVVETFSLNLDATGADSRNSRSAVTVKVCTAAWTSYTACGTGTQQTVFNAVGVDTLPASGGVNAALTATLAAGGSLYVVLRYALGSQSVTLDIILKETSSPPAGRDRSAG